MSTSCWFINSLRQRRGPSRIDLTDCRAENWFGGAYHTIQRTLRDGFRKFSLSIGHSQKIVSILGKYAFVVSHGAPGGLPPVWESFVRSCGRALPVPLDTRVLFGLKDQYPLDFPDILATRRANRKGALAYTARLRQGAEQWAWFRIDDYDAYWSLQQRIRRLSGASAPLEFEMYQLWVAE